MEKDTYFFSHDYNARSDSKIKRLLLKHGMIGYGVYWSIVEDLYNNANVLPLQYDIIAFDIRCDETIIKSVINDFGLFEVDGDYFGSKSVERRLQERSEKSEKARASAKSRWEKRGQEDANALPSDEDRNAIKEKKGKELKEKKEEERIGEEEAPAVASATCPYDEILTLFHETCPSIPKVLKLNNARKEKIRIRYKEMDCNIETLKSVFEKVESSDFCTGKLADSKWKASFDWIFENEKNWLKIIEGNYANKKGSKSKKHENVNEIWK